MFKNMDMRRLCELAGVELPKEVGMDPHGDSDAGLHGEQPTGGGEGTEEHLDKETSVFDKVHDALEELLDFLQSQEGFEEKRGKEDEYSEMEQEATALKETMKKHLSGYEGGDEGDEGSEEGHGEDPIKMVHPAEKSEMKPNKMSFR